MAHELPFEDAFGGEKVDGAPTFLVDLDGFEGPLDLLIELARRQKIDLHRISILALADQYLAFIEAARRVRLELAADYLVMAAYLAYLKSRLLIPDPPRDEEPAAADLAADLAARMLRLAAMRHVGEALMDRPLLGRDVFARGASEHLHRAAGSEWTASLFDLVSIYARLRQKQLRAHVTVRQRLVWSLSEARELLERLAGGTVDWVAMDAFLAAYLATPETRRTVRASSFSAALEMVREGKLDIRQDSPFAGLFMRRRGAPLMAAER